MKETKTNTRTRSPFTQIFGGSESPNSNGEANSETEASKEPGKATTATRDEKEENWGESVERAAANRKPSPAAKTSDPARIDTVRDLLFGDQINEIKDTLHTIESRLVARITKLEEDTKIAIDKSERHLKAEMEALNHELRNEKDKRGELATEVTKKLDSTALDLGGKVSTLGDELRRRLDEEASSIRKDFTKRDDLGDMLAELGSNLKGKPKA